MGLKFEDLVIGEWYTFRISEWEDDHTQEGILIVKTMSVGNRKPYLYLANTSSILYELTFVNKDFRSTVYHVNDWGNIEINVRPAEAVVKLTPKTEDSYGPEFVTIAGSHRFRDLIKRYAEEYTKQGYGVLVPPCYYISSDEYDDELKEKLIAAHARMITKSQVLLVVNPGGYIGKTTRDAIMYAHDHKKEVRYTNIRCRPEDMKIGRVYRFRVDTTLAKDNPALSSWQTLRLANIKQFEYGGNIMLDVSFEGNSGFVVSYAAWNVRVECYLDEYTEMLWDKQHPVSETKSPNQETLCDVESELKVGERYCYRILCGSSWTRWFVGQLKEIYITTNDNEHHYYLKFNEVTDLPQDCDNHESISAEYCISEDDWHHAFQIYHIDGGTHLPEDDDDAARSEKEASVETVPGITPAPQQAPSNTVCSEEIWYNACKCREGDFYTMTIPIAYRDGQIVKSDALKILFEDFDPGFKDRVRKQDVDSQVVSPFGDGRILGNIVGMINQSFNDYNALIVSFTDKEAYQYAMHLMETYSLAMCPVYFTNSSNVPIDVFTTPKSSKMGFSLTAFAINREEDNSVGS